MATGSPMILPQYMGDYYQLQNQQALAQALMQNALKSQAPMQTVGSGQYQVMPRMSPVASMSQLASALLGAKMAQGTAQGMNQLGANQWSALMGMMGGQPQGGAGAPSPQPDASSADAGAGDSAGMGATPAAGTPDVRAPNQSAPVSAGSGSIPGLNGNAGGGLNPLGMNPGFATMMYMNAPDKFFEAQAAAYKPAEIVQQIRAAGIDPTSALGRQVAQQALAKANYIAPVSLRPGGYMYDPMSGQTQQMPHVPEGFTAVPGPNGWQIVPVQGGQAAMTASATAKAAGPAMFNMEQVWDPTANNGQGGYVKQSTFNQARAANGAASTVGLPGIFAAQESGAGRTAPDNPLQIQQGTFNQYAQKGESWNNPADRTAVAQRVLNTYNQKYGGDIGRIATAYFSGEGNVAPAGSPTPFLKNVSDKNGKSVASYVGDMYGRASGMGASAQGGPMASQPPLGTTSNANTAQEAGAQTMHDSYKRLQATTSTANGALEALQKMQALAAKKNAVLTAGPLGTNVAPVVSPDAAEYEKQRANVISLLAAQNGTNGTDAGRALTGESVPDYGKPKAAIADGLQTLVNQTRAQQLKGQFLTPAYNAGDSKTYTRLENEFDRNMSPAMMPLVSMQSGPQRAAMLKAASSDPAMRARLEWAVQNGLIK